MTYRNLWSHDDPYLMAVNTVFSEGTRKENRTGVDTISAFGVNMRFDLRNGFPLLTTKRMNWWHIVAENLWFLSGVPRIDFLRKHGIKFWDPWVNEDGKVPSAYGNFWRHFPIHETEKGYTKSWITSKDGDGPELTFNDQIWWVVDELRRNPMTRRLVVSAWAPGNAQTSALPPCHVMFVLNVQNLPKRVTVSGRTWDGKVDYTQTEPHLCLHLTQRSCDMGLGVPYNIAGYGFILSVLAHLTGLKPGIMSHSLVDAHIYTSKRDGTMGGVIRPDTGEPYTTEGYDHAPYLSLQLGRKPFTPPLLTINPELKELYELRHMLEWDKEKILEWFKLDGYVHHGPLKMLPAV